MRGRCELSNVSGESGREGEGREGLSLLYRHHGTHMAECRTQLSICGCGCVCMCVCMLGGEGVKHSYDVVIPCR